jgi:hypothetical protein
VERAQATVEYAALVLMVVAACCLLVRFATPVEDIGRALLDPLLPDRPAAPHVQHRQPRPPRPRMPRPHRCYCPTGTQRPDPSHESGAGTVGSST